jgi:hypothetical protein
MWWRGIPKRRRRVALSISALVVIVIGVLLARYLSVEDAERNDILAVLQAQAHGDAPRELALLDGCAGKPSCAATVREGARKLRRPGAVKILSIKSPTAYTLTGATGTTRVAWTVIGRLPVVQCVLVSRRGNPLSGIDVTLRSLSAPIGNEADC